jgi:hypothetical protein
VLTLRAWSKDPRTPLDELPALSNDTFSPDTFGRLIEHILSAVRAADDRWQQRLATALGNVGTPFEFGRTLVDLRSTLARRVQLTSHPALPPAVREALEKGTREAITSYQSQLEDVVKKQSSRSSLDTGWLDQVLKVVRENSFLSVLDYQSDGKGTAPVAPAIPIAHPPADVPVARRAFRRVIPIAEN